MMKILKSKKGIAIENALLFMIIIFALCSLVAVFSLIGHYQTKIDDIAIKNKVDLDQIGEDFLRGELFVEGECGNYDYKTDVTNSDEGQRTALVVWHKSDTEKKDVMLYVEVDGNGNLIAWRYSK